MDYPDYTTEHQKGKHLTYEDHGNQFYVNLHKR